MRAALDHLAWDFDVRLPGVVTCIGTPAARIFRNAAGAGRIGRVPGRVPVRRPFPDIADHVVNAVIARREGSYGRRPREAVLLEVLDREFALPGIDRKSTRLNSSH